MSSILATQVIAIFETAAALGLFSVYGNSSDVANYAEIAVESVSATTYPTTVARVQAAIDLIQTYTGGVGGTVRFSSGTYSIGGGGLSKPNNVNLLGVSGWDTILSQASDLIGPMVTDYPLIGGSNSQRTKAWIRNIKFSGNQIGCEKTTGSVTAGSPTITAVPAGSFTNSKIAVDYFVEGPGIDPFTVVSAFNAGTQTVTMSANCRAAFTKVNQKINFRKAYKFSATADTTSYNMVCTGLTASVAAKMMLYGTNLDTDADDLSSSTRIVAVDLANSIVTLDRKPKTNGVFNAWAYMNNDNLFIPEPFYNPLFNSQLEYGAPTIENCNMTGASGKNVCCRPNRDQLVISGGKYTASLDCNITLTASNDSKIFGAIGIGTGWKGNLKVTTSSTFRLANFDMFDEAQADNYSGLTVRGCKQFICQMGEINGTVSVIGKDHVDCMNHNIRFSFINFKWHSGINNPDGTFPYYVDVKKGDVFFDNAYFFGDQEDNGAPDTLVTIANDARVEFGPFRLITSGAEVTRPYKINIITLADTSVATGGYIDASNGNLLVRFNFVAGTVSNTAIPAGAIGELIEVNVSSPGSSLTTGTITNIGSSTVSAGNWNVWSINHFILTGVTGTKLEVGLPGNSNTIPGGVDGKATFSMALAGSGEITLSAAPFQLKQNASSTQRNNVRATFTVGTVSCYGSIKARRVA